MDGWDVAYGFPLAVSLKDVVMRSWAEAISSEVKTLYRPCYNNGPGCPGSVFFWVCVGWLSLGQIAKTPVLFFRFFLNENAKRGIQQKLLRFGYTDFFLGVLELRTPEIFCLYWTLLLGKTCFATNMPNKNEHVTTNFITLDVMIFLWTKGHLILRGVPVLHFRGVYNIRL